MPKVRRFYKSALVTVRVIVPEGEPYPFQKVREAVVNLGRQGVRAEVESKQSAEERFFRDEDMP